MTAQDGNQATCTNHKLSTTNLTLHCAILVRFSVCLRKWWRGRGNASFGQLYDYFGQKEARPLEINVKIKAQYQEKWMWVWSLGKDKAWRSMTGTDDTRSRGPPLSWTENIDRVNVLLLQACVLWFYLCKHSWRHRIRETESVLSMISKTAASGIGYSVFSALPRKSWFTSPGRRHEYPIFIQRARDKEGEGV